MILTLTAVFVVLGFLIFIHELGHFIAARWVGIRVLTFSLGFGPRIIGCKRGDTDYRISAIPFGGYVKMAGETPTGPESQSPEETGSDREGDGGDLQSKSVPARFFVYIAGAAMNALVALLFTIGLAYIGFYIPAYTEKPPRIGWIVPGSPAETAGLQPGDLIQSVDGKSVADWEETINAIFVNPDADHLLQILRNEELHQTHFTPGDQSLEYPLGGIAIPARVTVGSIRKGSPADIGGLQTGDVLTHVAGSKIQTVQELQYAISRSEGLPVEINAVRNSESRSFTLSPQYDETAGRYLIGINFEIEQILKKHGFLESIGVGFTVNYNIAASMFELIGQLMTGKASIKSLGGPIMIGMLAGEAARKGLIDLIYLTAFISLNLAILNILPIPILDGGMILFLVVELINRKPVSEKIQIAVQNVFFFMLIAFALIISYNDIIRLLNL
ncbi:RIP metalloprotease RseP [bacterium]|nr:RIP metalloprotease RseP [candidate division CSSED10-310 bacterium]